MATTINKPKRMRRTFRVHGADFDDLFLNRELRNITEFTVTPNDNDFLINFIVNNAEDSGYGKVFPATYINNYYDNLVNTDRVLITSFKTVDGYTYKLDWKEVK